MALYLDASILVALVKNEPTRPLIAKRIDPDETDLLVSDLCVAESSAALAARGRASKLDTQSISNDFARLDDWVASFAQAVQIDPTDLIVANQMVRSPGVVLRTPDATHIAAADRFGARILTLDRGMVRAAAALGVPSINPAEETADRRTE